MVPWELEGWFMVGAERQKKYKRTRRRVELLQREGRGWGGDRSLAWASGAGARGEPGLRRQSRAAARLPGQEAAASAGWEARRRRHARCRGSSRVAAAQGGRRGEPASHVRCRQGRRWQARPVPAGGGRGRGRRASGPEPGGRRARSLAHLLHPQEVIEVPRHLLHQVEELQVAAVPGAGAGRQQRQQRQERQQPEARRGPRPAHDLRPAAARTWPQTHHWGRALPGGGSALRAERQARTRVPRRGRQRSAPGQSPPLQPVTSGTSATAGARAVDGLRGKGEFRAAAAFGQERCPRGRRGARARPAPPAGPSPALPPFPGSPRTPGDPERNSRPPSSPAAGSGPWAPPWAAFTRPRSQVLRAGSRRPALRCPRRGERWGDSGVAVAGARGRASGAAARPALPPVPCALGFSSEMRWIY